MREFLPCRLILMQLCGSSGKDYMYFCGVSLALASSAAAGMSQLRASGHLLRAPQLEAMARPSLVPLHKFSEVVMQPIRPRSVTGQMHKICNMLHRRMAGRCPHPVTPRPRARLRCLFLQLCSTPGARKPDQSLASPRHSKTLMCGFLT